MDGETKPMNPSPETDKTEIMELVSKEAHEAGYDSGKELLEAGGYDSAEQYVAMKEDLQRVKEAVAQEDFIALAEAKTEAYGVAGLPSDEIQQRIVQEFGAPLEEIRVKNIPSSESVTESLSADRQEQLAKEGMRKYEEAPTEPMFAVGEFASDVFTPEEQEVVLEREAKNAREREVTTLLGMNELVKRQKLVDLHKPENEERRLAEVAELDDQIEKVREEVADLGEVDNPTTEMQARERKLREKVRVLQVQKERLTDKALAEQYLDTVQKKLSSLDLNDEHVKAQMKLVGEFGGGAHFELLEQNPAVLIDQESKREGVMEEGGNREAGESPDAPASSAYSTVLMTMQKHLESFRTHAETDEDPIVREEAKKLEQLFDAKLKELQDAYKDYLAETDAPKEAAPEKVKGGVEGLMARQRASREKNAAKEAEGASRVGEVKKKTDAIVAENAQKAAERRQEDLEAWQEDPQVAETAFQAREKKYDDAEAAWYTGKQYSTREFKNIFDYRIANAANFGFDELSDYTFEEMRNDLDELNTLTQQAKELKTAGKQKELQAVQDQLKPVRDRLRSLNELVIAQEDYVEEQGGRQKEEELEAKGTLTTEGLLARMKQSREDELDLARKEKEALPENENPGAGVDALMARLKTKERGVPSMDGRTIRSKQEIAKEDAQEYGISPMKEAMMRSSVADLDTLDSGTKTVYERNADGEEIGRLEAMSKAELEEIAKDKPREMLENEFGEEGVERIRSGNEAAKEMYEKPADQEGSKKASDLLNRIRSRSQRNNNDQNGSLAAK